MAQETACASLSASLLISSIILRLMTKLIGAMG